ncbi:hypothetical protein LOK49_LG07G02921 [Camellia lanceoleosa]|uniref:Uncharacterized protein n=1 Tax=Camellia lanceoleosa TaxID=1840588 RepID=A0ACC0H1X3_9ERIC|nr:hypothetical protein LOK49_LG07G02921 [Camellia lanceoleosa]
MSSTMDSVNMSSTGDTNDVIDLSQSQSDKEHDPQPETPSGSKMYIAGRQLMFSTGEAQETVKNDLIGCLKVLEGELGDKPYFGGETFGIVDFGNFSVVAECPALVAWVHRCMEKKSVSKHLPDQHKMHSAGTQLLFSTGEAQETAKNDLIGYLKVLEGELGDKPYFGGETFGFVDVALIPSYNFFCVCDQFGNFGIMAECPSLVVWAHRCMEKESVSKSLPDQQKAHDFCLGLKKKLEAK